MSARSVYGLHASAHVFSIACGSLVSVGSHFCDWISVGWDESDLVFTAIATSGLTRSEFAERVVRVPAKVVERWVTGAERIPPGVKRQLTMFMALDRAQRREYIAALLEQQGHEMGGRNEKLEVRSEDESETEGS